MPSLRCAPKQEQADQNEYVSRAVEDAVPAGIQFKVLDCVDRIPAAQHVVPLKHLMQHDPVEEPAEAKPEEYARRDGKPTVRGPKLLRSEGHAASARSAAAGLLYDFETLSKSPLIA